MSFILAYTEEDRTKEREKKKKKKKRKEETDKERSEYRYAEKDVKNILAIFRFKGPVMLVMKQG